MSQYILESEIQYILSFNITKFRDTLIHNRRYTYHKSITNKINEKRYKLQYNKIDHQVYSIYHYEYKHISQITFYSAQYWSKNLKFNKDKSRIYTANTITLFTLSPIDNPVIKIDNYNGKYYLFGVPITNLTIRCQEWYKRYLRICYTFEYDFSNYCDSILCVLRAKGRKKSLFNWLPIEIIKTILILLSFLN
jgi:hypothetical protein